MCGVRGITIPRAKRQHPPHPQGKNGRQFVQTLLGGEFTGICGSEGNGHLVLRRGLDARNHPSLCDRYDAWRQIGRRRAVLLTGIYAMCG